MAEMARSSREHGCLIEQFTRIKPPSFAGEDDSIVAENWVHDIEETLVVLPCSNEQKLVSAVQASRLLRDGSQGFVTFIKEVLENESKFGSTPVVRDFPDVFLEELPGLPLEREGDFSIDLPPDIVPISKEGSDDEEEEDKEEGKGSEDEEQDEEEKDEEDDEDDDNANS
ncbi:nucleosome assembly protein 1;2-like [Malania oleifera]|uniref:nucleosome assembly protein 1;2-like n=1 Tax=Malania oleifera TaxID=397392 RepID=UPI0025AE97CC|nr:nucleosome assembly protein 1;2-like [Malania oleifera]